MSASRARSSRSRRGAAPGLAAVAALALTACCGPEVQVLRHDERGKLGECASFIVLAAALEGPRDAATASSVDTRTSVAAAIDPVSGLAQDDLGDARSGAPWAWAAPFRPGVISPEVEAAWRPPTTRGGRVADVDADGDRDAAPALVRAALHAARDALVARGLAPFDGHASPGARVLVLGVSLSTREVRAGDDGDRARSGASPAAERRVLARVAVHAGADLDGRFVRDLTSIGLVFPEGCAPGEPLEGPVARAVTDLVRALPD